VADKELDLLQRYSPSMPQVIGLAPTTAVGDSGEHVAARLTEPRRGADLHIVPEVVHVAVRTANCIITAAEASGPARDHDMLLRDLDVTRQPG